ncbi:hypothetical protein PVL29_014787 [Vitis rotundifolia]|uniref:Uncharacterized protein n=1 Tax=Vitis rotundifolia TaxID=103349 RepID=A0AA38ZJ98_VITRO|nr:hypothetical protein PVL29_014787 [Vitis rotundifolia]
MEEGSGRAPEEGTEIPDSLYSRTLLLFHQGSISANIPTISQGKDFYSVLFRSVLKVQHLDPGRLICLFSVIPAVANYYGGAIAAIVELVSIACARTVVDEDKELFLGELSMSYLSAAPTLKERHSPVCIGAKWARENGLLLVFNINFYLKVPGVAIQETIKRMPRDPLKHLINKG